MLAFCQKKMGIRDICPKVTEKTLFQGGNMAKHVQGIYIFITEHMV